MPLNLDAFFREIFPFFIGKFEAFYIFCDVLAIYGCAYCFIWFLEKIGGR